MPILFCLLFSLATGFSTAAVATEVERWNGYAYDLETGELVYSERHERSYSGNEMVGGHVTYLDPAGKVIAEKSLEFKHPTAPVFEMNDSRISYQEGLKQEGAGWVTYKMEPGTGELQSKPVELKGEPVADAGFDRYIVQQWDALSSGERMTFDFIVPSQLRAIDFRVEKVGEEEREGRKLMHLELRPDGFLLRNLVSPIQLYYDSETRNLVEYQGISNVRKLNGKGYKARIVFPLAERKRETATASHDCQATPSGCP